MPSSALAKSAKADAINNTGFPVLMEQQSYVRCPGD
jgi:hypothetical protein